MFYVEAESINHYGSFNGLKIEQNNQLSKNVCYVNVHYWEPFVFISQYQHF